MASHRKAGAEKVDDKMREAEPNPDQMARQVQNLLEFKNFYD